MKVFMLWITLFMSALTISLGQLQVESCISYNASGHPMLNIMWNDENSYNVSILYDVLYRPGDSNVSAAEHCNDGNNITNIPIRQTVNYATEVRTIARGFCLPNSLNPHLADGSFTAEYGYLSNVDITSSQDNSSMTFTCHMACQTDFITGCNIKIMNTCGNEFNESCTVDNTQTFSSRQCSVVFEDLPASSYAYIAEVRSENLPQPGANKFNMTGFFVVTAGSNNVPCENSSDEVDNGTTTDNPISDENATVTNNDNSPSESPTNATEMPNNTTADNDDGNNDSDVDDTNDSNNNDNSGNMSPNDSPSNTTASSEDDEGILDRIESLPVPIIASVGAVILILIIVVVLLIILFCRMKKSSKNDKSKETGLRNSTARSSFTFQNSTTALVGSPADSCSDSKSDVHTLSEPFGDNIPKSSSYDHLAKPFKPKQPTPLSHQNSYRSEFTDDSFTGNSDVNKLAQSYEASITTRDEELLDDFDYDEIEDTPSTHTSTQYNNLIHSGKEHRLKIECPPAPTIGTYERLSQPPSEDNYAVPPELDDVNLKLNNGSKSNHDYDQVPPELNLSGRNSANIPTDVTYDRLSPKLDNTYDQVPIELQYDVPTCNPTASASNNQYDTLLPKPKPPVLENQSRIGSHSIVMKHQTSPVEVRHSPGPVTGDMYTVPKKFEIKSPRTSHDYDTVEDTFESKSTMF